MPSWDFGFRAPVFKAVSKFQLLEAYDAASDGQYELLPLKFMPLDGDQYVLTNMAGEYAVVPRETVHALAKHTLVRSDRHYLELRTKHFFRDADFATSRSIFWL